VAAVIRSLQYLSTRSWRSATRWTDQRTLGFPGEATAPPPKMARRLCGRRRYCSGEAESASSRTWLSCGRGRIFTRSARLTAKSSVPLPRVCLDDCAFACTAASASPLQHWHGYYMVLLLHRTPTTEAARSRTLLARVWPASSLDMLKLEPVRADSPDAATLSTESKARCTAASKAALAAPPHFYLHNQTNGYIAPQVLCFHWAGPLARVCALHCLTSNGPKASTASTMRARMTPQMTTQNVPCCAPT
jgi:hypothetical protein